MKFSLFDLEVLAETQRILKLLVDNELIAIEQRNRATFCAKYCDQLQRRVIPLVNKEKL
ncbi:hypothetical protein GMB34_13800 [Turicibacter sanguinis]|nr:hypothetical protein [Turicibacter sanguinis]MTN83169.1 hypothetical protein [Turicibacter sanguinis]MTN88111.1 hypothetical protein [Turicibacter sanguinis]MTN90966.1 hypothetical protein [Turicibacter sanguinis]MTN93601.1 hypothetical protein [Turicibacter sanguinis]